MSNKPSKYSGWTRSAVFNATSKPNLVMANPEALYPTPRRARNRVPTPYWPRLIRRVTTVGATEVMLTAAAALTTPLSLAGGRGQYQKQAVAPGPRQLGRARLDGGERPRLPQRIDGAGSTACPVILVHGLAGSQACWFALGRALRGRGVIVVPFNYSPFAPSAEQLADQLAATVENLLDATGADKVHLIGHSLGGVIIAQALIGGRLAGCVEVVITLGAPFGGSPWASLLPIGPLARALRAGSPLLRRLAAAAHPPGVRWLAFASTLDMIAPADRCTPANMHAELVRVDAAGHAGMLLDPHVINRIVAATAQPDDPLAARNPPPRPQSGDLESTPDWSDEHRYGGAASQAADPLGLRRACRAGSMGLAWPGRDPSSSRRSSTPCGYPRKV